jgi:hypothetical protein
MIESASFSFSLLRGLQLKERLCSLRLALIWMYALYVAVVRAKHLFLVTETAQTLKPCD